MCVCVHTHICTCGVCVPVSMRTPIRQYACGGQDSFVESGLGIELRCQACVVSIFAY